MTLKANPKVALLGNPNSGKSSLFNHLTGLNQKVGNFPGVTVDKKSGKCRINDFINADIIDLPGIYSLYPKSYDEQIVFDFLNSPCDPFFPDILVVIADASNLKRNLLLFSQVKDLGFPVVLALNMMDMAERKGIVLDTEELKKQLKVPVVLINARTGKGLKELKEAIANPPLHKNGSFTVATDFGGDLLEQIKKEFPVRTDYHALQLAHQFRTMGSIPASGKEKLEALTLAYKFKSNEQQNVETIKRYELLDERLKPVIKPSSTIASEDVTEKIDNIITHKIWGYLIFFLLLFLIFQAIFSWASLPMDIIDESVASFGQFVKTSLPDGPLNGLITDGIIAGLGGILIFIPQIAILFAFISILEESGYMSRVMFMMDKVMKKFGMNGKSVVPLISGVACAVPAIMATRNIDNWKDRLVTIFVTPLMSCSARIPVFTVLIALVVPETTYFGLVNLQGLVLMGLYLLGFAAAMGSAFVLSRILKTKEKSYFILEFPEYRLPRWKNVGYTIIEKVKAFVFEAGKIILAISIVLWVLSSYGPGEKMEKAKNEAIIEGKAKGLDDKETETLIASKELENSFAGIFGKTIEPVIKPLGFDWKIGIALITSFAAREVFVGTMATIYSVADDGEGKTVKEKMRQEINPATGSSMYTPALGFSLLVFYLFAMQCMSTIAIVYRETKGWKWPLIQFAYMTVLAYTASLFVYQIFS